MNPIIECVPNFSEGRDLEKIAKIRASIEAVPGVYVLDVSSDPDHNRTVITFAGDPAGVEEAAYQMIAAAARLIDLFQHKGEHPRIGATDVVPFIPIQGVSMDDCVALARRLAERVGTDLAIPVFLYEKAALRTDRVNLEDIRRGEFEELIPAIQTDPYKAPDFGPQQVGPAGATVIGARDFLVAYNIYLTTSDVSIAKKIATAIRHSSGGLRYVKGMGILVNGMAQVSMNLTNFGNTPLHRVTELVRREAARYGTGIKHAELVGLIPRQALLDAAVWYLQLDQFSFEQVLENRLEAARTNTGEDE